MIIKQLPQGHKNVSEILQSKEFKEFRKSYVPVKSTSDEISSFSALEAFLEKLRLRISA